MIHQHQGHGLILPLKPAKEGQRNLSGLRAYDSVPLPILSAQVALYGSQDVGVVIDG
jgi:hypothetical protein